MATQETQPETVNHWRKNIDANFICGEDLHESVRGLHPEMIVTFSREQNREAYDKNANKKTVVTGIYLKDLTGRELEKPVVMNKINGRFFAKEFGTPNMDKWPKDRPFYIYAQPDPRFNFVVRFRKYEKIIMQIGDKNFVACQKAYQADAKNLEAIRSKYSMAAAVEIALITPKK